MKNLIYWIPTLIFGITFFAILLIFHPLQVIARAISYNAHKLVVDAMVWSLNKSLLLMGMRRKTINHATALPTDRPLIIVSNHQSMFDIPTIGQVFRKHHPKYISKKSLAKGIPSISYNIRHGGSVIIDRKDKDAAVASIKKFCQYLNQNNYAGCIFPEGTRSKNGSLRPFRKLGLAIMLEQMPDATVVPVLLQNYWKIGKYNMTPIPFGIPLKCTVLQPIVRAEKTVNEIITEIENQLAINLDTA